LGTRTPAAHDVGEGLSGYISIHIFVISDKSSIAYIVIITTPHVTVAIVKSEDNVAILCQTNWFIPGFSRVCYGCIVWSFLGKNIVQRIIFAAISILAKSRYLSVAPVTQVFSHAGASEMVMIETMLLRMTHTDIQGLDLSCYGVRISSSKCIVHVATSEHDTGRGCNLIALGTNRCVGFSTKHVARICPLDITQEFICLF